MLTALLSGGSGGSPAERIPGAVYRPVKWVATTQMPQARARACAVATDDGDIYVLGMINCRVRDLPTDKLFWVWFGYYSQLKSNVFSSQVLEQVML